jgi:CTP:molybdopterin cytidylyltransferase MocA
VLEHLVAALRSGGVEHVVVVIGPHVPELAALAEAAGADVCVQPEGTADMRSTVEHGLRWLEDRYHPAPDDPWLLTPADYPALDPAVVRALFETYATRPSRSMAVPVYEGRRGHPTLIAWRHVAGIRAVPLGLGVNAYLRAHTQEIRAVPVTSAGVVSDLDTPEDYERLLHSWPAGPVAPPH